MNDERPIEKLLRRYAKKRRADAGPPVELHPATRRLLQGEVARQFRKEAGGGSAASFAEVLKGWRLAWVLPVLALVAVGLWSLLDRPATKQLALGPTPKQMTAADAGTAGKNRHAEQALAFGAAPDQPVVSLNGAAEQKGEAARGGFKEMAGTDKLGIVAPAAPARPRLAEASPANQQKLNESNARLFYAKTLKSVAPLLDTPSTSATLTHNDSLERVQAQTYSQSFANLAPEPFQQKTATVISPTPISPVLANFRVEQTGRQLRVVDSDGSTYLGETDASPVVWTDGGGSKKDQAVQLFQSDGKLTQLPAAATAVPQQQRQTNFYRVAGTNRTLNQTVVFMWDFVVMTNAPDVAQSGRTGGDLNKNVKKLPAQFPVPLQNAFINGRAQFGTGKEIEINAVPVSP